MHAIGHYACVGGATVGGNDRLSRTVFVTIGLVAALFATWDLVANFSPTDIVGAGLLVALGVIAVRSIRRTQPRRERRPAGFWRNLVAVILTWLTLDFVLGAVTGSGDAHHEHWFVLGYALAGLWFIVAHYWFPRSANL